MPSYSKNTRRVYIVVGTFTNTYLPLVHMSAYNRKKDAEKVARQIGGVVVPRLVHDSIPDSNEDPEDE